MSKLTKPHIYKKKGAWKYIIPKMYIQIYLLGAEEFTDEEYHWTNRKACWCFVRYLNLDKSKLNHYFYLKQKEEYYNSHPNKGIKK